MANFKLGGGGQNEIVLSNKAGDHLNDNLGDNIFFNEKSLNDLIIENATRILANNSYNYTRVSFNNSTINSMQIGNYFRYGRYDWIVADKNAMSISREHYVIIPLTVIIDNDSFVSRTFGSYYVSGTCNNMSIFEVYGHINYASSFASSPGRNGINHMLRLFAYVGLRGTGSSYYLSDGASSVDGYYVDSRGELQYYDEYNNEDTGSDGYKAGYRPRFAIYTVN